MAEPRATIRDMTHEDLSMVSDIERRSYEFPWSHGVFRDCLLAGYQNIVLLRGDEVAGYGVLSVAAGEAHILNICVNPDYRSRGYGEKLLDEMLFRARTASVRQIFLEVRPSNVSTRWLTGPPTTRRTRGARMPRCWPRNSS
jgi:ribosomal-protein-alanine N-acetyltransferase